MSKLVRNSSHWKTLGLGVLALGMSACTIQARGRAGTTAPPPPPPQQEAPPPAQEPPPAVTVAEPAPPPVDQPPPAPAPVEVALPPIPARWARGQRRQAIICNGAETLTLRNMVLDHRGNAIVINGSCKVRIKNSYIRGTRHGIVINGSATLSLVNSRVVGWNGAIRVNGSGFLTARGNELVGGIKTNGAATFDDKGGNRLLPPPAPLAPPPRPARPAPRPAPRPVGRRQAPPTECGGNQRIRLANVMIDGGNRWAVRARGNCRVEIVNSQLRGRTGVNASGNAQVIIRRSEVTGNRHSLRLNGNAEIRVRNSLVQGRVQRTGNASLRDNGGNTMR